MGENEMSKVRLKGKALKKLNNDIHERDGDTCIIKGCGRFVLPDEKFHHHPFGINKTDRVECGCLLCQHCHHQLHFGENSQAYKHECEEYLRNLYPGYYGATSELEKL